MELHKTVIPLPSDTIIHNAALDYKTYHMAKRKQGWKRTSTTTYCHSHWMWYKLVKLSKRYHQAKFDIYQMEFENFTNRLTLMITQTHIFSCESDTNSHSLQLQLQHRHNVCKVPFCCANPTYLNVFNFQTQQCHNIFEKNHYCLSVIIIF